jgi:hypothetical protein
MSDIDSRTAGLGGQALPPGGNVNEWQAGLSIKAWNDAERARQEAAGMPQPNSSMPAPTRLAPLTFGSGDPGGTWSPGRTIPYSGAKNTLRGNPLLALGGFLGLIFVAAPLYQYSVPLWMALYPAAAAASAGVYIATWMSLAGDHSVNGTVIGLGIAFIAAWPLTMGEHIMSRNPGYCRLRHFARLALLGVWAIYALSLRDAKIARIPNLTTAGWPHMVLSPINIGLALALVVIAHFWLSKFRT